MGMDFSLMRNVKQQEFVVVWNGVNDGLDNDLLSPSLDRHPKVEAAAARKPRRNYGDAKSFIVVALKQYRSGLTSRELTAMTGLASIVINACLMAMQEDGDVEGVDDRGRVIDRSPTSTSYRKPMNRRYRLARGRNAY